MAPKGHTSETPEKPTPVKSGAPDVVSLPPELAAQVEALEARIKPSRLGISRGEIEAISMDCLDGYIYGERTRWDTQGRKWEFRREIHDGAFCLATRCSLEGILLSEALTPLNRIAGKEGEEALLATVARMADWVIVLHRACYEHQQAMPEVEVEALPATEAQEGLNGPG
jgi:hypothetical protein